MVSENRRMELEIKALKDSQKDYDKICNKYKIGDIAKYYAKYRNEYLDILHNNLDKNEKNKPLSEKEIYNQKYYEEITNGLQGYIASVFMNLYGYRVNKKGEIEKVKTGILEELLKDN